MIIPKKLVLHNVCQHVHKTLNYKTGITGITGRNGAGKSNLVTVAQYYAITGKTYDRSKAEMLHWDASRGSTEFTFQHGDQELCLTRAVNSGSVKLISKSEEIKLTGAEANHFMADAIGCSNDALLGTCWVLQGDLGRILKMTDTERIKFFQNLAGVRSAENVRKHLQTGISRIPTYEDKSEEIKRLLDGIPEHRKATKEAEDGLKAVEKFLAEHKDHYQEQIAAARLPSMEAMAEETKTLAACLGTEEATLKKFLKENEEVLVSPDNAPVPLSSEEHGALAAFGHLKKARDLLGIRERTMGEHHPDNFGPTEEEEASLASLIKAYGEAERKVTAYKAGKCSECQRPYEGNFQTQQTLIDTYEQLERDIHLSETILGEMRLANESKRLVDLAQATVDNLVESTKAYDEDALRTRLKERQKYDEEKENRQHLRLREKALRESCAEIQKKLEIKQAVQTISQEQREAAQKVIEIYERKMAAKSALDQSIATTKLLEERAKIDIQKLEAEQARAAKAEAARDMLTEVREAFHTNKAPRMVMQKMLIGLNARMMNYLGAFEVEFSAYVNDKFQIICRFAGGKEIPARLLSGGQSVALAVALRFSLSDLLAGNLPLIVMDEPTVFLDEANVARLAQVLEKVRGLAKRGLFIQVATHEPEIMTAFTRTIEV